MAKITLTDIASELPSTSALNDNFTSIEAELQNRVLYRDNPTGEPNTMLNDLDMNSYDIVNVDSLSTTLLNLNGVSVTPNTIALTTFGGLAASFTGLAANNVLTYDGTNVVNSTSLTLTSVTATTLTTANLTVSGDTVIATETPATAAATGTTGQIAWDADYIYICTATNTWKRVAIATW